MDDLVDYCANCDYINDTDKPCFNCGSTDKITKAISNS